MNMEDAPPWVAFLGLSVIVDDPTTGRSHRARNIDCLLRECFDKGLIDHAPDSMHPKGRRTTGSIKQGIWECRGTCATIWSGHARLFFIRNDHDDLSFIEENLDPPEKYLIDRRVCANAYRMAGMFLKSVLIAGCRTYVNKSELEHISCFKLPGLVSHEFSRCFMLAVPDPKDFGKYLHTKGCCGIGLFDHRFIRKGIELAQSYMDIMDNNQTSVCHLLMYYTFLSMDSQASTCADLAKRMLNPNDPVYERDYNPIHKFLASFALFIYSICHSDTKAQEEYVETMDRYSKVYGTSRFDHRLEAYRFFLLYMEAYKDARDGCTRTEYRLPSYEYRPEYVKRKAATLPSIEE